MKLTKNSKLKIIFSSLIALMLCLVVAFSTMSFTSAKADGVVELNPSSYFGGNSETTFENDQLVATVKDDSTLTVTKELAVKDLAFGIELSENVEKVTVTYKGTSKYANGVKVDDKYDTAVSSVLTINKKDGKVALNGAEYSLSIGTSAYDVVFDNENQVTFGGLTINSVNPENHAQKTYNGELRIIKLSFSFQVVENATEAEVKFNYISTKNTDDFKQTFVLNTEKTEFATLANPVAVFPSDKFAVDGDLIVAEANILYENVKLNAYSLVGSNADNIELKPAIDDSGFTYSKGSSKNYMRFTKAHSNLTINCVTKDSDITVGSFNVKVVNTTDDVAPAYNGDVKARESFINAFLSKLVTSGSYTYDAATDKYTATDAEYVALGSNKYLNLPSMEDLVSDGTTAYSALKYTVYYKTPTTSSSTSSKLRIPLTSAGKYYFYVVFEDSYGNKMDADEFFKLDDNDNNNVIYGTNKDYVFTFSLDDNAEIKVTPASAQGNGYVGVKFNAAKFDVVASTYTENYVLYYTADKTALDAWNALTDEEKADAPLSENDKWVAIPKASTISDENYNKDGFTYDDVKSIAYDGKLAFTPDREGYYVIHCNIESETTGRFDEAYTDVIEVAKQKTVKPENKWLQNNVWSVVFLSVGSLCLIGIIVLLCIKPKKPEDEE